MSAILFFSLLIGVMVLSGYFLLFELDFGPYWVRNAKKRIMNLQERVRDKISDMSRNAKNTVLTAVKTAKIKFLKWKVRFYKRLATRFLDASESFMERRSKVVDELYEVENSDGTPPPTRHPVKLHNILK